MDQPNNPRPSKFYSLLKQLKFNIKNTNFHPILEVNPNIKWQCVRCTFENTKNGAVCDMCMWLRSSETLTPPEQPQRLSQQEMANKHWNYIVRYCRLKKQSFIDDSFPPGPTSLYYCPEENKDAMFVKWKRLKDVATDDEDDFKLKWAVFRSPQPSDILQGQWEIFVVFFCWYFTFFLFFCKILFYLQNFQFFFVKKCIKCYCILTNLQFFLCKTYFILRNLQI